ncbi:uncharacterized protein LOC128683407 isoform X3 [Plodia interpunctella]|uniref:uncharacterized protein LOC128683407 isoform X3 n=1 Tax=Plodia interpunctella TaxID=58824 RepID=UPI002367D40D|nr:uncharacterized protein LOC128683407 isoform X3 [Plodia interpunctella]
MHVQHRIVLVISLLVILTWAHGLEAKKLNKQICPIGFKVAYNRAKGDHICYKRKELEPFSAVLDDCDGNLYSSKLHNSLDIFKLEYSDILWSEYKSFYPGGPFVSWSRNDREWSVVTDVNNYDPYSLRYDISQDLCLAVNRTGEYIAVQCDDKYYRYCFVKPYSDVDDMRRKGCEGFRGSYRFVNSKDICLLGVTGVGGGTVRATWNQSQALCSRHGGTLLSRGWQYANVPMFHISDVSPTSTYPLGIVWDPERKVLRYVSEDNVIEKPFEMSSWNSTDDTMFIAIKDESWTPVNSSYIFFDVICEHSVQLRNLTLTLSVNPDNKIILDVNDSVDKDDVHCTTDSESYRPTKVKIHHDDDEDNYVLSPATDGYYWCEHIDRYNFQSTQSNKVLFVRERESLINLYSVKIKLINDNYTFSNAAKKKEFWIDQLQEYVFYRTKYVQMFDVEKILNPIEAQKILRDFKASRTELRWRDSEAIYNSVVKRLYMNKNTVLLHVELNPEMIPVTPGFWGNIEVVAMKPAYYCKGFDSVPRLSIGETTLTRGCRTYSCLGDFNEGVQWLETETNDCVPSSSVPMTVTILSDVTMKMPTLGTLPSTTTKDEYLDIVEEDVDAEDVSEYNPDDIRNETFTTESSYEKNVMTEETVSVTDESGEDEEEATTFITTRRYPIWPPYTTVPVTVVDTPRPTTVDPPITVNPTITPPPETTTPPPETTTPPLAPDEQLEQVIHDLEQLLQDDSVPLTVDMVDDAFDQVNSILEVEDDLTIPGDLLHMLDELGNRISLNGSHTASAIRGNVALLMADAAPDKPVRGVRMAVMDPNSDTFTNDTFDFINSEINSTQIASNKSEAVVYLPESVTSSPRRISFVIFRNERAFRGNQTVVVNSRIVSVNVENVTEFEEGECPCCDDARQVNYLECKCCHYRKRREAPTREYPRDLTKLKAPLFDYDNRKIINVTETLFGTRCVLGNYAVVNQSTVTLFSRPGDDRFLTHPLKEEWKCRDESPYSISNYNTESGVTFLQAYERNYTWSTFGTCGLDYPENVYCYCCLLDNENNQVGNGEPFDYWDELFKITPLPSHIQLRLKDYWTNEAATSPDISNYDQSVSDYIQNLQNLTYHLFGPKCDLDNFAVVNQSIATLFYRSNSGGLLSNPLFGDWLCKEETAHNIKMYNAQLNVSFLHTYVRNFDLPAFGMCEAEYSENVYCYCCLIPRHKRQGPIEPIRFWDNLYGITPLPTFDSEKEMNYTDEFSFNETTTSADYPNEDYEDYKDYAMNESDGDFSYMVTTTLQPTATNTPTQPTIINPSLQVDQDRVLEELEVLLQEESSIPMTSVEYAINNVNIILNGISRGPILQVDSLFEDQNVTVKGELLQQLDRLGPRVDLKGSQSAMIVRDNLAVIVVDGNREHPVNGLRITTDRHDAFNTDCFDLITDDDYTQYITSNESDAVVSLPSYVTSSNSRISFVIFRDDRAFQHISGRRDALVNSRILSVNIENVTKFEEGVISLYLRPIKSDIGLDVRRACAYWKFLDDGTGYWSEDGCVYVKSSNGVLDMCQCDHMTHFAEVIIAVNRFSEGNEIILEILSITGCCLSIIGILLVVITALVFHSWRKEFSNKIWLQLCLAIFIFNCCFLLITFIEFEPDIWCVTTGVIMHYSLLVSFFWMLIAAIVSYERLVLVFKRDITRKHLKSSLLAWGIPLFIIAILFYINPESYVNKFEDTSRNSSFCYPSGLSLWLTVYLPLTFILFINWTLFILILRSMFATKKIRRHGNSKDALRSAVVSSLLVFLFGLPWIFGLIAYNIIAAYVFTISASFQGFVLFFFFIVANKHTRDLWIRKLRSDKGRVPVSVATGSVSFEAGGSDRIASSNKAKAYSVELHPFGAVKLRESDEIKSLLQRGVLSSKTEYTRPDQKPDEYYE